MPSVVMVQLLTSVSAIFTPLLKLAHTLRRRKIAIFVALRLQMELLRLMNILLKETLRFFSVMRFDGESVPVSNNKETEPVSVEKDDSWGNGFIKEGDDDHVKVNGNRSSFTPGDTDLNQLPAIPPTSSGQGLPFAPVDFPSPGDVWTWRVGRRANNIGLHKDRFLILPERLKRKNAPKSFASKNTLSRYLETNFPDMDTNAFFASISWNIPALFQTTTNRVGTIEEIPKEGQNQDENAEDVKKEGSTSRFFHCHLRP